VQRGQLATFPPGQAREDWTILRAFSAVVGKTLPYDTLAAVRARLEQVNPVFSTIGSLPRFGAADRTSPAASGEIGSAAFVYPVPNYYQTDPISRASPTMAACVAELQPQQLAVAAE
jgi:NADH-quinone oxidoreductase subunit G